MSPSNDDIRGELLAQSHVLYGDAGLGGSLGPLKEQFDRYRPEGWPYSGALLRMFGLMKNAEGWRFLLQSFGFMPADCSEVQTSSQRRKERAPAQPSIPSEDESYPGLVGNLTHVTVLETPLGSGLKLRTTIEYISIR